LEGRKGRDWRGEKGNRDWREGRKYCLERRKGIIKLEKRKAICAGEKGQNKDWREGRE
jgi:hypothetical protein